jgi:hypothetical protein
MPALDPQALTSAMLAAATNVVGIDVSAMSGFSQQQLTAIAQQSAFVAGGIADGSITDDTRDFFLNSLVEMAKSFANILAGLVAVMVEQVWNAVVGVIWDTINKATGLALAIP